MLYTGFGGAAATQTAGSGGSGSKSGAGALALGVGDAYGVAIVAAGLFAGFAWLV